MEITDYSYKESLSNLARYLEEIKSDRVSLDVTRDQDIMNQNLSMNEQLKMKEVRDMHPNDIHQGDVERKENKYQESVRVEISDDYNENKRVLTTLEDLNNEIKTKTLEKDDLSFIQNKLEENLKPSEIDNKSSEIKNNNDPDNNNDMIKFNNIINQYLTGISPENTSETNTLEDVNKNREGFKVQDISELSNDDINNIKVQIKEDIININEDIQDLKKQGLDAIKNKEENTVELSKESLQDLDKMQIASQMVSLHTNINSNRFAKLL